MKQKMISIVMPALNEELSIGKTIDEIPVIELQKRNYNVEILVIDGYSRDKTVEIAKSKGAKVILSKRGYGRQYKIGFKQAKGDIIVTGDSDLTYPFRDVPKFIECLETNNLDFITTNRFAKLKKGSMTISHRFGNMILTIVTNILFGVNIRDSQSGMWIFKREILNKLRLRSNGMPLSQEIKIDAFRKVKSKELPIVYRDRVGEVKLNTIKDGFRNMSHLFLKLFGWD